MITGNRQFRIAPLATWLRRSLVVTAVLLLTQSAEAGMMTSMSGADEIVALDRSDTATPITSRSFLLELRSDLQKALAQQPGGSSTSTSAPSIPTGGSGQSLIAASQDPRLGLLLRSGWIVPEAVQALPPLLPSGLFRPPCA